MKERYCMICQNGDCANHGKMIPFLGDCFSCEYLPFETNSFALARMNDSEKAHLLTQLFYQAAQQTNAEQYILEWLRKPVEAKDEKTPY